MPWRGLSSKSGLSLRKLPNGRIRAQLDVGTGSDGRRRWKAKTSGTERAAQRWLREQLQALDTPAALTCL